jgi:hypothetical protein
MNTILNLLANTIVYDPGDMTPAVAAQDALDFCAKWIAKIGGIVAFVGAIKFALGFKSEEANEKIHGLMTMISGFMIISSTTTLDVFKFTTGNGDAEFTALMDFIGVWTGRLGLVVSFIGAFMFMLALKDNNPNSKISGTNIFMSGVMVFAISNSLTLFV